LPRPWGAMTSGSGGVLRFGPYSAGTTTVAGCGVRLCARYRIDQFLTASLTLRHVCRNRNELQCQFGLGTTFQPPPEFRSTREEMFVSPTA
jgi:hypothetical protein